VYPAGLDVVKGRSRDELIVVLGKLHRVFEIVFANAFRPVRSLEKRDRFIYICYISSMGYTLTIIAARGIVIPFLGFLSDYDSVHIGRGEQVPLEIVSVTKSTHMLTINKVA